MEIILDFHRFVRLQYRVNGSYGIITNNGSANEKNLRRVFVNFRFQIQQLSIW